jgi:hypothetical protein
MASNEDRVGKFLGRLLQHRSALEIAQTLAVVAAQSIAFEVPAVICFGLWIVLAAVLGGMFLNQRKTGGGKYIESMAGVWCLVLYLSLGIIPLALRAWGTVSCVARAGRFGILAERPLPWRASMQLSCRSRSGLL